MGKVKRLENYIELHKATEILFIKCLLCNGRRHLISKHTHKGEQIQKERRGTSSRVTMKNAFLENMLDGE